MLLLLLFVFVGLISWLSFFSYFFSFCFVFRIQFDDVITECCVIFSRLDSFDVVVVVAASVPFSYELLCFVDNAACFFGR